MIAEFAIFVAELGNFDNDFNKREILVNNNNKVLFQYINFVSSLLMKV